MKIELEIVNRTIFPILSEGTKDYFHSLTTSNKVKSAECVSSLLQIWTGSWPLFHWLWPPIQNQAPLNGRLIDWNIHCLFLPFESHLQILDCLGHFGHFPVPNFHFVHQCGYRFEKGSTSKLLPGDLPQPIKRYRLTYFWCNKVDSISTYHSLFQTDWVIVRKFIGNCRTESVLSNRMNRFSRDWAGVNCNDKAS